MRRHVGMLGVLHAALGLIHLGLALGWGFGPTLATIGTMELLLAWGLLRWDRWARMATIALSIPGLLVLPAGTVLAMYSLWVLTSDEATDLFLLGPDERFALRIGPTWPVVAGVWAASATGVGLLLGCLRWTAAS